MIVTKIVITSNGTNAIYAISIYGTMTFFLASFFLIDAWRKAVFWHTSYDIFLTEQKFPSIIAKFIHDGKTEFI